MTSRTANGNWDNAAGSASGWQSRDDVGGARRRPPGGAHRSSHPGGARGSKEGWTYMERRARIKGCAIKESRMRTPADRQDVDDDKDV